MADAKKSWCNSQRTQSIVMVCAGMLILFLSEVETDWARRLVPNVGLFLFIYGVAAKSGSKEWESLSRKQKIIKTTLAFAIGVVLAFLIMFLMVKYN